jgi:hypothetical protein
MWPWNRLPSGYLILAEEADGIDGIREPKEPFQKNEKSSISRLLYLATFALLCLAIGFTGGEVLQDDRLIAPFSQLRSSSKCTNPTTRCEWRSLSTTEKESYIAAVRCLSTTPSMLREGGVLYDDFPYIHHHNGKNGRFRFPR